MSASVPWAASEPVSQGGSSCMTSACMARRDMVSSFDGDEKEAFAVRALSRTTGPSSIRAGLLRLTDGQTLGRRVLHSIRAPTTPVLKHEKGPLARPVRPLNGRMVRLSSHATLPRYTTQAPKRCTQRCILARCCPLERPYPSMLCTTTSAPRRPAPTASTSSASLSTSNNPPAAVAAVLFSAPLVVSC